MQVPLPDSDRIQLENEKLRKAIADLQLQAESEKLKRELAAHGAAKREEHVVAALAEKDKQIADLTAKLTAMGGFPSESDYPGVKIETQIADSGQAVVYRGTYRDQDVAVKIFKFLPTEEHLKQYRDEIDILMYAYSI